MKTNPCLASELKELDQAMRTQELALVFDHEEMWRWDN